MMIKSGIVILLGMLLLPISVWAQSGDPGPPGIQGPKGRSAFEPFDPSPNVKDLNEAGLKAFGERLIDVIKRQDDLRIAEEKLALEKISHTDDISKMRKELSDAEVHRIDERDKLRAEYVKIADNTAKELREAEASRINAIRQVDVAAVTVANERSNSTAAALANQVIQSAEVLRAAQQRSTEDIRAQIVSAAGDISKRVTVLEQAQSEGRGKQTFQDPVISNMAAQIERLLARQADSSGRGSGQTDMFAYIIMVLGVLIALGALLYRREAAHKG